MSSLQKNSPDTQGNKAPKAKDIKNNMVESDLQRLQASELPVTEVKCFKMM